MFTNRRNAIAYLFTCFALALSAFGADKTVAEDAFLDNGVTAHRGFSGKYPENTLQAFEQAIKLGADWLECDIYKSSDGKLVVIHDRTTKRTTEENLLVAETPWEKLKSLDSAYGFRRKHGLSLEQCPKVSMPLLEDVIRLVIKQNRTRLSIQPKQPIVDDAIALIRKLHAEKWVGFNEGTYAYVRRVKELAPKIPVFYDTMGTKTDADIERAKKHGFETIVMHFSNVTQEDVDAIHAAKLKAGAWTVNNEKEMRRLLGLGIDRIYTDRPDVLLQLKQEVR